MARRRPVLTLIYGISDIEDLIRNHLTRDSDVFDEADAKQFMTWARQTLGRRPISFEHGVELETELYEALSWALSLMYRRAVSLSPPNELTDEVSYAKPAGVAI